MAKSYFGSINLTQLLNAAKEQHPAFSRSEKNKHVYVNVTIWENDEPDKYGNLLAAQVNPPKDSEAEKFYIGNFKLSEKKLTIADTSNLPNDDDLPF